MTSDMNNFIMKVNLNSFLLGPKQIQRHTVQLRLYRFSQKGANRKQNHGYVIRNKKFIQFLPLNAELYEIMYILLTTSAMRFSGFYIQLLPLVSQDQDGTQFHPGPARKLFTNLYDIYHCECTVNKLSHSRGNISQLNEVKILSGVKPEDSRATFMHFLQ